MSLQYRAGDLLTQKGIIVHGCNCHGGMGAGIAKVIRNRFPAAFNEYKIRHVSQGLYLGDVVAIGSDELIERIPAASKWIIATNDMPQDTEVIIANAMTQYDFKGYNGSPESVLLDYDALEACFSRIAAISRATGLPVHIPLIGCGLAGGSWELAAPRILKGLGDVDAIVWVLSESEMPEIITSL